MIQAILFTAAALSLSVRLSLSDVLIPDEQRLYHDVMNLYSEAIRPAQNASSGLVVSFSLSLNQIIDLNERTQVLTTNLLITQTWKDENLGWDPKDYNGIRSMRIPADRVWLPDTFVFNNADEEFTGFIQGVFVMLDHNGNVNWPAPVKLKSSCKVDIRYFPFDDQTCTLRFGSWIHPTFWLDYQSSTEEMILSNYIDNSEWYLLSANYVKGQRSYACCPEDHWDLTYTLHIRRRTLYYIFNIIVPCIMLSVLTLLTFWLPPTSGEKISLGLSVFLAFSMFMLLIAEEVPPSSESVPLIGVYLITVMTMTSVSVILAVIVINMYQRGEKAIKAPGWLKIPTMNCVSVLLRMKYDTARMVCTIKLGAEEEEAYRCEQHPKLNSTAAARLSASCSRLPTLLSPEKSHHSGQSEENVRLLNVNNQSPELANKSPNPTSPEDTYDVWVRRHQPDTNGNASKDHLKETEVNHTESRRNSPTSVCNKEKALLARKETIVEWQIIATVLDRLLFWVFLLGTISSFIVIILVAPNSKVVEDMPGKSIH